MNLGGVGGNIVIVLLAVAAGIVIFFFRWGRRPERTRVEIARNLVMEVRLNLAMATVFHQLAKPRQFEMACWQVNKTRLGFLNKSVQTALSEAFIMAEDYNRRIKLARKQKNKDLLAGIDSDKLKELLAKSRQGLEQWLVLNTGSKEPPPKYPGITDMLFGSRDE